LKRYITATLVTLLLVLVLSPGAALAKGVILNFTDVDIATMVKFISDLTGKNFVMDERVKGKISVYSPAKLSSEEAFNVFTSVLELKGFTLIQAGKVYKVVPLAVAKQSGTRLYSDKEKAPVNESYVARVITLENIPAQEALTFLQPTVSKDGHLSAFGPANMLLVVDSALNIQKVLEILKVIDAEKKRESAEILYLKNAAADNVAKIIQEWLGSRSPKQSGQQGQSTFGTSVLADGRLNALFVFGSDKDKEDIRKFVALIDVPPPNSSSKVNVYPLENADATEVAKVLDGVVKGAATAQPPQGQGGAPQQSPFDAGKITITADKASNSLIIMASPTDYQNLLQVIQKLDKRRRQVFVQALIAEVSVDKLQELGVQWGLLGGGSTNTASVAGVYDPTGTFTTLLNALGALKTAGISNTSLQVDSALNFSVALKALQSNDILNVLSSPTILTSDNKEAEIFVGENVPFLGTSTINGAISQQSVERKDTGITLKITPQINEGNYIRLDISEEISALKDTVTLGANTTDRTTTKRSAKTSVVVKDLETVAIGGLINESDQEVVTKVPLLGDIPLLGWFFKSKTTKKKKTNLILLLTPQVVRDERDLADATSRQRKGFAAAANREEKLDILDQVQLKQPTAEQPAGAPAPGR
jgi:general secretion pathway protein D